MTSPRISGSIIFSIITIVSLGWGLLFQMKKYSLNDLAIKGRRKTEATSSRFIKGNSDNKGLKARKTKTTSSRLGCRF
ncbi:MAG: hypothetical protein WAM14_20820 [Candidatus Nitrosopolaris sp.]